MMPSGASAPGVTTAAAVSRRASATPARPAARDRRFFLFSAVAIALVVLGGFARSSTWQAFAAWLIR
jgi:hypothetical protein